MKKLLFSFLTIFICFSCDIDDKYPGPYIEKTFNIVFTVSGDSPFISINNTIHHGLFSDIDYIINEQITIYDNKLEISPIELSYIIQKHTDDSTYVLATLEINDILVASNSISSPYGYIEILYAITNDSDFKW